MSTHASIFDTIDCGCAAVSSPRSDQEPSVETKSFRSRPGSFDDMSNSDASRNTGPSEVLRRIRRSALSSDAEDDESSARLAERRRRERMSRPATVSQNQKLVQAEPPKKAHVPFAPHQEEKKDEDFLSFSALPSQAPLGARHDVHKTAPLRSEGTRTKVAPEQKEDFGHQSVPFKKVTSVQSIGFPESKQSFNSVQRSARPPQPMREVMPRKDLEAATESDDDEDSEGGQTFFQKYKKLICGVFAVVLLIIIIVVAVTLAGGDDTNVQTSDAIKVDTPTAAPSPAAAVTGAPTSSPTTSAPTITSRPTRTPTMSPTIDVRAALKTFLEEEYGITGDSDEAISSIEWLVEEAETGNVNDVEFNSKLAQRFAVLTLDYALLAEAGADQRERELNDEENEISVVRKAITTRKMVNQDECFWLGVTCNADGQVTKLSWGDYGFRGSIPTELRLLDHLQYLDLSKNSLRGKIPEELYDLADLKYLYLYHNQLTGTISAKLGNLTKILEYNVASNQIGGTMPDTMINGTANGLTPIRVFNVHNNQMTGTIPELRLRRMFYMDLGKNKFTGTIPASLGENYVRLRHLHLDHNQLSGTVPSSIINAGDGRLNSLSLHDNQLTGALPGDHEFFNKLVQYTVYNNNFTSMDRASCGLSVYFGGELTEFKSDCDICPCGGNSILCIWCVD